MLQFTENRQRPAGLSITAAQRNVRLSITPNPSIRLATVGAQGPAGADGAAGAAGVVQSVVAGSNITVDSTNPAAPIVSSSAAGVTDGDKGDIVVSSTGTVWTIDPVTGTGDFVRATSPTLVTPALGTPASGVVTNLTGTASININGTVGATTPGTGAFTSLAYSATLTGTSTSANAIAVGRQGATDPVLKVNANTASVATGIEITGAAAAGRVALAAISSGTNEGLSVDAKGSGTIRLGATSTGAVEFSRNAVPTASDGAALGTTSLMWADLFAASGFTTNYNNGDLIVTHTNGSGIGFTWNAAGSRGVTFTNSDSGGSSNVTVSFNHGSGTSSQLSLSSGSCGFGTVSNTQFSINSNNTERLRIAGDGSTSVRIDTATPAGGSTAARLLFGTTSGFGIYYGSGVPTVSAAQGSIYIRSDGSSTSTRLYVNTTGSTTWTNFTSAA